jgi:hypothetical protein
MKIDRILISIGFAAALCAGPCVTFAGLQARSALA